MARVRTKRLVVNRTSCPNLIAEAKLYRYPSPQERQHHGENPIDDNNHALAALRYLISRVGHRFIAKLRRRSRTDGAPEDAPSPAASSATPPPAPRAASDLLACGGEDRGGMMSPDSPALRSVILVLHQRL